MFDAHCLTNGHAFEAYDFSDFDYGERIIRTTDGQDFSLLAFDDPVVKELQKLLDAIYGGKLDELERAKLFNRVFGLTCDLLSGIKPHTTKLAERIEIWSGLSKHTKPSLRSASAFVLLAK